MKTQVPVITILRLNKDDFPSCSKPLLVPCGFPALNFLVLSRIYNSIYHRMVNGRLGRGLTHRPPPNYHHLWRLFSSVFVFFGRNGISVHAAICTPCQRRTPSGHEFRPKVERQLPTRNRRRRREIRHGDASRWASTRGHAPAAPPPSRAGAVGELASWFFFSSFTLFLFCHLFIFPVSIFLSPRSQN